MGVEKGGSAPFLENSHLHKMLQHISHFFWHLTYHNLPGFTIYILCMHCPLVLSVNTILHFNDKDTTSRVMRRGLRVMELHILGEELSGLQEPWNNYLTGWTSRLYSRSCKNSPYQEFVTESEWHECKHAYPPLGRWGAIFPLWAKQLFYSHFIQSGHLSNLVKYHILPYPNSQMLILFGKDFKMF